MSILIMEKKYQLCALLESGIGRLKTFFNRSFELIRFFEKAEAQTQNSASVESKQTKDHTQIDAINVCNINISTFASSKPEESY